MGAARAPGGTGRPRAGYGFWFSPGGTGGKDSVEVRVHPEDLGTVIGRGGRTAKALRQVIGSIGGRGIRVDIVDAY